MASTRVFEPKTDLLPAAQQRLFAELGAVPSRFVLYGGTAITLRLGHRASLDFDFFSNDGFEPGDLEREISLLQGSVRSRSEPNTLVSVVDRGGPVNLSFFGGLPLRRVGEPERAGGEGPLTASLVDLAATKVKVVQDRAAAKDYFDLATLLAAGIHLSDALSAALAVYGPAFNPLLSLKALSYFEDGDLPDLEDEVRERLTRAVRDTRRDRIEPATPRTGGLAGERS